MTPEKVASGRQLFFDERLSIDGSKSCYSCHVCEKGLTDGLPKAIGPGNKTASAQQPDALEHRISQRVLLGWPQRFTREAGHGRMDGR